MGKQDRSWSSLGGGYCEGCRRLLLLLLLLATLLLQVATSIGTSTAPQYETTTPSDPSWSEPTVEEEGGYVVIKWSHPPNHTVTRYEVKVECAALFPTCGCPLTCFNNTCSINIPQDSTTQTQATMNTDKGENGTGSAKGMSTTPMQSATTVQPEDTFSTRTNSILANQSTKSIDESSKSSTDSPILQDTSTDSPISDSTEQPNSSSGGDAECSNFTVGDKGPQLVVPISPATSYVIELTAYLDDGTNLTTIKPADPFTTNATIPNPGTVTHSKDSRWVELSWNYTCPYTGPVHVQFEDKNSTTEDPCFYQANFSGGPVKPFKNMKFMYVEETPDCNMDCAYADKNISAAVTYCGRCKIEGPIKTLPDVPSKPRINDITSPPFDTVDNASRTVTISWEPPDYANGVLKRYEFYSTGHGIQNKSASDDLEVTLVLEPDTHYKFTVTAMNEEPEGKWSEPGEITLNTIIGTPFFKPDSKPVEVPDRSESVLDDYPYYEYPVTVNPSTFSETNGKVTKFELQLRGGDEREFKQVYKCEQFSTNEDDLTIILGNEKDVACGSVQEMNKPLTSNTHYYLKILIYTEQTKYNDRFTAFRTKARPLGVVVAVGLLLGLVVVAGVAVLTYKYYRNPQPYLPLLAMGRRRRRSVELPLVVMALPDQTLERRSQVSALPDVVRGLFANSRLGVQREFAELRSLSANSKPHLQAIHEDNKRKNRYLNILPFDETRVVLSKFPGVANSDYINASYIHGYSKPRQYIAAQGPMENGVSDFWRMVWEKNVYMVVMVTQCIERNTLKCSMYWPDETSGHRLQLRGMQVHVVQEVTHHHKGYIIRKFRVTKGMSSRQVLHYHFVAWPDMGCPNTPDQLLGFIKDVRDATNPASKHVLVHCSAGVGRTGTFIGLNNLMEEMAEEESVDVFSTVYRMRQQRMNMVQTEAQYGFLYKCVLQHYLNTSARGCRYVTEYLRDGT